MMSDPVRPRPEASEAIEPFYEWLVRQLEVCRHRAAEDNTKKSREYHGHTSILLHGIVAEYDRREPEIIGLHRELDALRQQLADAEELHRMQLAAVTAAAVGNTRSTAAERIGRENPYWTAAYHDVCEAVDREIRHREKLAEAEERCAYYERFYNPRTEHTAEAAFSRLQAKLAEAEKEIARLTDYEKTREQWHVRALKAEDKLAASEAIVFSLKTGIQELGVERDEARERCVKAEAERARLKTHYDAALANWKETGRRHEALIVEHEAMTTALSALVEKWRDKNVEDRNDPEFQGGIAAGLEDAADELAALLAAHQEQPK